MISGTSVAAAAELGAATATDSCSTRLRCCLRHRCRFSEQTLQKECGESLAAVTVASVTAADSASGCLLLPLLQRPVHALQCT
jgi:hypothetical protein